MTDLERVIEYQLAELTRLRKENEAHKEEVRRLASAAIENIRLREDLTRRKTHSPYPENCWACGLFFGTSRSCEQPVEERLLENARLRESPVPCDHSRWREAEAELADLHEELTNRNLLVNKMYQENAKLRDGLRDIASGLHVGALPSWYRMRARQLVEEAERG